MTMTTPPERTPEQRAQGRAASRVLLMAVAFGVAIGGIAAIWEHSTPPVVAGFIFFAGIITGGGTMLKAWQRSGGR